MRRAKDASAALKQVLYDGLGFAPGVPMGGWEGRP